MAGTDRRRGGKQSPQRYVADLVELVGALANMPRNGGPGVGNNGLPMDPTVNVKEQLSAAVAGVDKVSVLRAEYEEKLRNQDKDWQQRFENERGRADENARKAEAGRIDNKLTDIQRNAEIATDRLSTAAATLATTVATTADAAQKAVQAAAQQQSELLAQVRDTVTLLQTSVTSIIAAGGARVSAQDTERTESRQDIRNRTQNNQWLIGLVGGLAVAAIGVLSALVLGGHIK
jgi:hypothetical protein